MASFDSYTLVFVLVWVVLVGHSGARAVWG